MLSFLKKIFSFTDTIKQTNTDITQYNKQNIKRKRRDYFNKQVDRNLLGRELEAEGKIDEAIVLYEKNVEQGFIGSFPYDRLSIIYRKQGRIEDEIRVLERAIEVFEKIDKERPDRDVKLQRYKDRLEKARKLLYKN